jgi:hypothetical protein
MVLAILAICAVLIAMAEQALVKVPIKSTRD